MASNNEPSMAPNEVGDPSRADAGTDGLNRYDLRSERNLQEAHESRADPGSHEMNEPDRRAGATLVFHGVDANVGSPRRETINEPSRSRDSSPCGRPDREQQAVSDEAVRDHHGYVERDTFRHGRHWRRIRCGAGGEHPGRDARAARIPAAGRALGVRAGSRLHHPGRIRAALPLSRRTYPCGAGSQDRQLPAPGSGRPWRLAAGA